jgi:hypothetical protein
MDVSQQDENRNKMEISELKIEFLAHFPYFTGKDRLMTSQMQVSVPT